MDYDRLLDIEKSLIERIYKNDVYISKYSSNLTKEKIGRLSTKGYNLKKRLKEIQLKINTLQS